jgi:membrane associated rhomboid family serine protease
VPFRRILAQASELASSSKVLAFCFALAALTGFFSALQRRLGWRDTIVAAGVSGAGGLIVGAVCVYLWGEDKWYLTCAGCGLAGWLGGNIVLDRLSFVAWTIAQGRIPSLGNYPDKEAPHNADPRTVAPSDGAHRSGGL